MFNANILSKAKKRLTPAALCSRIESVARGTKGYTDKEIQQLWKLESSAAQLRHFADDVLGNPPWVNWEYLPKKYRDNSVHLWAEYGLFDFKGMDFAFVKEDVSSLISYVTMDRFIKAKGTLSFIVKESLFKSGKQATGFRNFRIKSTNTPFSIQLLEDLTNFRPFEGVNNKTVIFYAQKGQVTNYPVEFKVWIPQQEKTISSFASLQNVLEKFTYQNKKARPIKEGERTSSWCSLSQNLYQNIESYLGNSFYRARIGVFTGGANGIYWVQIKNKDSNRTVTIRNMVEKAKIKFEAHTVQMETALLHPYMSGRDLSFWGCTYTKYIPLPHSKQTKMFPFSEEKLKETYPLTHAFFELFRKELQSRKGFTAMDKDIHAKHYYTLQRIGDYTFTPYKVAWKYISPRFVCSVIENVTDPYLGTKTVIPNEKICYIGLENKHEAYYLCALLSSTAIREVIDSFKVSTQIAPGTIKNLNLPKFNPKNKAHCKISTLCEKGHAQQIKISDALQEIDALLPSILKKSIS